MGISAEELYGLIQESEYTAEGWFLKGNIGNIRLGILYDFYRELILDGKIPLSCISGVKIMHDIRDRANFEISHIFGIRESLLDIVKNLQLSVYPAGNGIEYGFSNYVKGKISLSDIKVTINNAERKSFIKSYAFTCTENIALNVRMSTNTGKTRMSGNAKLCPEDTHLPLTTNHSVGNYINIHAMNGNVIRHTVDTNMLDFDAFSEYFINYLLSSSEKTEVKQVNVNDIFNAMYSLVDPRYKKSWQQFTDNFYDKFESHQYTLEHLKKVYAGKSRSDSISRISAVKGVSYTSAEYFLKVYLEQYFGSEWVQ
jgi:hypothetical protein